MFKTYGADASLLRDLFLAIYIDFIEPDRTNSFRQTGELLEDGGDHSARATPGGPEVNDDDSVRLGDLIAPIEYQTPINARSPYSRWTEIQHTS